MPDGAAKNDACARDAIDIVIVGVQVTLIACGVPVLGVIRTPEGESSSESLVVEGGLLRWVRLSGYSPDGKSYSLVATACRLDECRLWVDEESGTLKIRAGRRGSMGWMLCDTPAPALTLPLEEFEPAGLDPWPWEVELCPYYSPDLVQYLRDQGVEVV